MRLSREHAEAVIARALELQASDDTSVRVDDLMRVGAELGIPQALLERSLVEVAVTTPDGEGGLLDRVVGPTGVVVERWTRRDVADAATDLSRRLERLHLTRRDQTGSLWVQNLDWWPDLHRTYAPVILQVDARRGGESHPTVLRVRARLDEARRNHVAMAAAALLAAPLLLAVPVLAAGAAGVALGALGSYRLRLRSVERCVAGLLDRVAEPAH